MTAVVSTLSAGKRLAESGLEIPLRFIRPCLKNYPDWRVDIEGPIDSLPIGEKLRQRSLPSNRRGDRSRRNDDLYLFLKTLLSAREKFYLGYVGKDNV